MRRCRRLYTVTVEKTGFKKLSRANIEIRIAQRLDMDLRLEVGDVQQTVAVTAEAPLLETSAERGQNISTKFMDNLPLFSGGIRNPRAFVNYMPGVTNNGEQSVSGSGGRAQEVLIDGGSALNVESSAVFNFPSAEMFSEFKMLQSNYSAEYGRVGGGIEIYVSKSGTNWFHGAAFHNMRRDIWNANAWARNANPNPAGNFRPKERFNETGGAIGGPVYVPKVYDGRNKTLLVLHLHQGYPSRYARLPGLTVPTAAMKQGNFSAGRCAGHLRSATTAACGSRSPATSFRQPASAASLQNLIPLIPDPDASHAGRQLRLRQHQRLRTVHLEPEVRPCVHAQQPPVVLLQQRSAGDRTTSRNFAGPIGNGLAELPEAVQLPRQPRLEHPPNLLMHTTYLVLEDAADLGQPEPEGAGQHARLQPFRRLRRHAAHSVQRRRPVCRPTACRTARSPTACSSTRSGRFQQGYTLAEGQARVQVRLAPSGGSRRSAWTWPDTNGRYVFNRAQTGAADGLTSTGHEFASLLLGAVDAGHATSFRRCCSTPPIYYDTSVYFQDNWRITRS